MKLLSVLMEKPWLSPSQEDFYEAVEVKPSKRTALVILLVVITVFFTLFIVTFLARSQYPDFEALASNYWQPFYNPQRLWLNTSVLLLSSVSVQMAVSLERARYPLLSFVALCLAVLFAIQFIIAQLYLFNYLYNLGFTFASNAANSYFFLLATLHALHLLAGLVVLGKVVLNVWRDLKVRSELTTIRLCAIYWHYLFVVWILLVALTICSPQTYTFLASLCGY